MADEVQIEKAEKYIEKRDYAAALNILKPLSESNPDDGRIAFDFGRIALVAGDMKLAFGYFQKAVENGFENSQIYLLMGSVSGMSGKNKEAGAYYEKAVALSADDSEKMESNAELALFYVRNKMFLNSEKISKQMINEHPDNYLGYHLLFCNFVGRDLLDEAEKYLESIEGDFSKVPRYYFDKIELLKRQGKLDEYIAGVEKDDKIMGVIPSVVLKYKFSRLLNEKNPECAEVLKELIFDYPDVDSLIAEIIILFADGKYKECSELADAVLNGQNISDNDIFIVLYLQIFALFKQANGNPSEKLINWIADASAWCVKYAESLDEELAGQVKVTIKSLFEAERQTGK